MSTPHLINRERRKDNEDNGDNEEVGSDLSRRQPLTAPDPVEPSLLFSSQTNRNELPRGTERKTMASLFYAATIINLHGDDPSDESGDSGTFFPRCGKYSKTQLNSVETWYRHGQVVPSYRTKPMKIQQVLILVKICWYYKSRYTVNFFYLISWRHFPGTSGEKLSKTRRRLIPAHFVFINER